jgi:predicted nucleotidyltransferase
VLSVLLKSREFSSAISEFYKNRMSEILDVVVFGSAVKGKEKPNDVDVLLLFRDKEDLDAAYELRKKLEKFVEVHVTTKTYAGLFDRNFKAREVFLGEGYSMVRKEFVSKGLGYANLSLFKYELKGFSQSKRMQLQYALYGRDRISGVVKEWALRKFADSVFLCPVYNVERLKEFFDGWSIRFEQFPVLIPERVV